MLREIVEETGYTDVSVTKSLLDELQFSAYHPGKKVNRYGMVSLYMCQLTSEKQIPRFLIPIKIYSFFSNCLTAAKITAFIKYCGSH